ncbi:Oplophorus-luciferin 2-monooxygenase non-catalytic subunit, partial [Penaeus vannamei]
HLLRPPQPAQDRPLQGRLETPPGRGLRDLQRLLPRTGSDGEQCLKGGSLWLDDNALASLDEDAFRPLLSDVQAVYLAGNPLSCSCDIAWLVRRPALMARVADDATCNNGQLLVDLDPAMYDALC